MAKAATWASLVEPSAIPATRAPISEALRIPPSRLWRISSAGRCPGVASGGTRAVVEGLGAEGQRQKLAQGDRGAHSLRPGEVDGRVRARELGQLLPAPAARRAQPGALGHDEGLDDLPVASRYHGADVGRLRALADRVGRVLDVAPRVEPTARGADAGSDAEARVRRMGVGQGLAREVEHRLEGAAHRRVRSLTSAIIAPSRTGRRWRGPPPRGPRSRRGDTPS